MSSGAKNADAGVLALGAWGGVAAGVALFVAGIYSFTAAPPPPGPLSASLVIIGFCGALSSFFSAKGVRLAWAFATSINGTLAVVMALAAPRLRDLLDVSLVLATVPAIILIIITVLLSLASAELENN